MGMGPIIWTCLALTVHQNSPQVYFMPTRNVGLPISVKDKERKDVKQFILLYSADQGATWEQGDSKRPGDPNPFAFHATKDGVYWFLVQQEDLAGKPNPQDPNRVKPSKIIVVDTTLPEVTVTAERLPNGKIRAHWTASDQNPDPRSLRMDYHVGAQAEGQWTPLGITPGLEGSQDFSVPEGQTGDILVRVQMKDQAGNVGGNVAVVSATAASSTGMPSSPAEGSPIGLIPTARSESSGQANQLTSQQSQRPLLDATSGQGGIVPPLPPSGPNVPSPAPAPFNGMPIASNADRTVLPAGGLPDTPANSPTVKIVKVREVRLDFTVGKVGPSGLGNADIYVTLDKGASWKKMPGGDVPITLPPGADTHGTDSVSGSVSVQLPAEGIIYGFIVAVKSKAGLAPPPPKPGDPPEVLVELDTTAPKGQLFRPLPDARQPNTLLLAWEAKDRNLADTPITLEWAEQKDGPWNAIGEGPLPNTGQYPWRLPDHLPPRVYLRLTMRDLAGNEARAQTDKPELIDLSVPQTKIIRVEPASR